MTNKEKYISQLNQIKAPAALRAKLLALPEEYANANAATQMQEPQPPLDEKKPEKQTKTRLIPFVFPAQWKKYALTAAACFVIGAFSTAALDTLPKATGFDAIANAAPSPQYTVTEGKADSPGEMMEESAVFDEGTRADDALPSKARTVNDTAARKIIYISSLTLETKNYDETAALLADEVTGLDGFLAFSELTTNSNDERTGSFTYRVPSARYAEFLQTARDAASLTYQSEHANDVTTQYIDLTAYINAYTAQRDRLLVLQEEAQTLSELLEIEENLAQVQSELDSYQGQLNYLSDQVDYATITIYLREVVDYSTPDNRFGAKLSRAFMGGLSSFAAQIGDFALLIVSLWVWIALAFLAVFVYHSVKRKKARKPENTNEL